MRVSALLIVTTIFTLGIRSAPALTGRQSRAERDAALRKYGLDSASPLESRIAATPASVLKMFADEGVGTPTKHVLTANERHRLTAAFAILPPLHRRTLSDRLRSISFLDGMPNTALTSTVNPDEPYRLFDITVRAGVLNDDVSVFLTWKERTCFDTTGSSRNVFIEAGTRDALGYVLLHEVSHIVDFSVGITPVTRSGEPVTGQLPAAPFTRDVWTGRTAIAAEYRDPLLERIRFRAGGEVLPIDRAEAVYTALGRTPFVSLYGSSSWSDDLAELATLYHFTQKLGDPYRIVIRDAGTEVFAYEPMTSPLVRARFDQLARFYDGVP
jgi:hypothetical protein